MDMTFEESMQALEKIVKKLEDGEMPIEKSIEEFEKGIKLVKNCRKLLDTAQKQVTTLIGDMNDEKEAN